MRRPWLRYTGPFLCFSLLLVSAPSALAGDESVAVTARFFVTPGREAEAEARFLQLVSFVGKAEPHVVYSLQRSMKDPRSFLFYEVYPDAAARQTHGTVTLPAFSKEHGPTPDGLYSQPPEIETYKPLAE